MDPVTLQRLMMDDSLGELSADAGALLAAYVRGQPGDEAELSRWQTLTENAAAVLGSGREATPVFPLRAIRLWRVKRMVLGTAAAAVMVFVGLSIGLCVRPRPLATAMEVVNSKQSVPAHAADATDDGRKFWSRQRVLAAAMESRRAVPPAYTWSWNGVGPTSGEIQ